MSNAPAAALQEKPARPGRWRGRAFAGGHGRLPGDLDERSRAGFTPTHDGAQGLGGGLLDPAAACYAALGLRLQPTMCSLPLVPVCQCLSVAGCRFARLYRPLASGKTRRFILFFPGVLLRCHAPEVAASARAWRNERRCGAMGLCLVAFVPVHGAAPMSYGLDAS